MLLKCRKSKKFRGTLYSVHSTTDTTSIQLDHDGLQTLGK